MGKCFRFCISIIMAAVFALATLTVLAGFSGLTSGVDLSTLVPGVDLSTLVPGVDLSTLVPGVDLSTLVPGVDYAEGELIVAFDGGGGYGAMGGMTEGSSVYGPRPADSGLDVGGADVRVVRVGAGTEAEAFKAYAARSDVLYVQPNFIYRPLSLGEIGAPLTDDTTAVMSDAAYEIEAAPTAHVPNDPYYRSNQQNYMRLINAEQAWAVTTGAPHIKIAVIDTGIRATHREFIGRLTDQVSTVDATLAYGDADVADTKGHGTHVAGIIGAAMDNGAVIAGIAPGCMIMPVKAGDDDFYTTSVVRGIGYALDKGARVINMSLGGDDMDRLMYSACKQAESEGVLVVVSAGNDASKLYYPASYPTVVSVAATEQNGDSVPRFTANGSVDIAAPGISIYSAGKDSDYGYAVYSGSSQASPAVAAAAGLLLSRNPGLEPDQVRQMLYSTAKDSGRGVTPELGYGLLDIYAALNAATDRFDALEPNDIYAFAKPIEPTDTVDFDGGTPAVPIESAISFVDDIDTYTFDVNAAADYRIGLTAPASLTLVEPFLYSTALDAGGDDDMSFADMADLYTRRYGVDYSVEPPKPYYPELPPVQAGTRHSYDVTLEPGTYYISVGADARGGFSGAPYVLTLQKLVPAPTLTPTPPGDDPSGNGSPGDNPPADTSPSDIPSGDNGSPGSGSPGGGSTDGGSPGGGSPGGGSLGGGSPGGGAPTVSQTPKPSATPKATQTPKPTRTPRPWRVPDDIPDAENFIYLPAGVKDAVNKAADALNSIINMFIIFF